MPREPKPVTIDGVEYCSAYAAAKALGLSRKTIEYRLRNNIPVTDWRERQLEVIINGQHYPSMQAAARSLGTHAGSIRYFRNKLGPIFSWPQPPCPQHGLEVEFDGKTYPSIAEAARQLGLDYSKMWRIVQE